jgi:hypothetical protein
LGDFLKNDLKLALNGVFAFAFLSVIRQTAKWKKLILYSNYIKVKKTYLLVPFVLMTLASCSNEDENEMMPGEIVIEAPETIEESVDVISGDSTRIWINESFVLGVFGNLDCRNDDIFTFFSDGTYQYDGGSLLCGDSDNQQIVTGAWELDFENGRFIFDKDTDREAEARYIVLRDDLLRVSGSWNSIPIDARYVRK